jgi:hypothetical protein
MSPEQVEERIEELAENLRKMAVEIGVHDHRHAAGITLMQKIYEHFGNKAHTLSNVCIHV